MAYSNKKGSVPRTVLELGATVLLLIWLFGYIHMQQSMAFDFRGGSDVLLAFVLAGIHAAVSIAYLAGVRLRMQLVWLVLNVLHAGYAIWLIVQAHSSAALVFTGILPVLNDLFLILPALWFLHESRTRMRATGVKSSSFFKRKERAL